MVIDIFLKIDGIPGESADARHRGEIQCETFNWGLEQTQNLGSAESPLSLPTAARGGKAKAIFQDFTFKHKLDKASPRLIAACAAGTHIKTALLVLRKAGAQQQEFLKVTLTDLLVSSVTLEAGSTDVIPLEVVTLRYANIEISYFAQKPDGSLDAPITASCAVN